MRLTLILALSAIQGFYCLVCSLFFPGIVISGLQFNTTHYHKNFLHGIFKCESIMQGKEKAHILYGKSQFLLTDVEMVWKEN